MTLDVGELVQDVARDLNDPLYERRSEGEYLGFFNHALRLLSQVKPAAFEVTAVVALQAGSIHHVPDHDPGPEGTRPIAISANVSADGDVGRVVTPIPLTELGVLDRLDPHWRSQAPVAEVVHSVWDPRRPRVFLTYPPVLAGTRLEVSYVRAPVAIEGDPAGQTVDVNAAYAVALRHAMLSRAHGRDTSEYGQRQAERHLQLFHTELQLHTQAEARTDAPPDA